MCRLAILWVCRFSNFFFLLSGKELSINLETQRYQWPPGPRHQSVYSPNGVCHHEDTYNPKPLGHVLPYFQDLGTKLITYEIKHDEIKHCSSQINPPEDASL
jgi:hypothetical protein